MAEPVTGVKGNEEKSRMDAQAEAEPKVRMPGDYPDSFTEQPNESNPDQEQTDIGDDNELAQPEGVQSVNKDKTAALLAAIAQQRKQQGGDK